MAMAEVMHRITETALDWLRGHPVRVRGERVLVFTYDNIAYLGNIPSEDRGYIERYHFYGGEFHKARLDGKVSETERRFSEICGREIENLLQSGAISRKEPPRQYDGAAIVYELA
jgi:hypothetical protein